MGELPLAVGSLVRQLTSSPQSIFPHGIDVLRKIDFFTISVRKRAFLEAAPQVAE